MESGVRAMKGEVGWRRSSGLTHVESLCQVLLSRVSHQDTASLGGPDFPVFFCLVVGNLPGFFFGGGGQGGL